MTTATANDRTVTTKAKAFTGQPIRQHKFLVSADEVRVWDSVAGYYTVCHSLSAASVRRIRKMASK